MSAPQTQQPTTAPADRGRRPRGGSPSWNATTSVVAITVGLFLLSWVDRARQLSRRRHRLATAVRRHPGHRGGRADHRGHAQRHRSVAAGHDDPGGTGHRASSPRDHGSNLDGARRWWQSIAIVVGLVNGIVVAVFKVTPLVATLAVNAVLVGAALAYSGGTPTRAPQSVADFALGQDAGCLEHGLAGRGADGGHRGWPPPEPRWGRRVIAVGANERRRPHRRRARHADQGQRIRRGGAVLQRSRGSARRLRQHTEHQRRQPRTCCRRSPPSSSAARR